MSKRQVVVLSVLAGLTLVSSGQALAYPWEAADEHGHRGGLEVVREIEAAADHGHDLVRQILVRPQELGNVRSKDAGIATNEPEPGDDKGQDASQIQSQPAPGEDQSKDGPTAKGQPEVRRTPHS